MKDEKQKYFLPYQLRWLEDPSKIKIWDKSRRIGATYVQSYEDVRDCVLKKVPSVWFSSADESAAKEYIIYCAQWAKLFDKGARDLGEVVIESEYAIKTFQIQFSNGTRIIALSSNPKAFRSKGGKVILDEFAHHEDARSLWKAARPSVTWGYPIRILSTHKGKSLFYNFIESIKQGKLKWGLHTTDLRTAAYDGLVEKIMGKKVTKAEIEAWIEEQRRDAFDDATWLEEYCCTPVDEGSAFLSYEMISSCEVGDLTEFDIASPRAGNLYLGMDIGRKKDLSVIWLLEKINNMHFSLKVHIMEKTPFRIQRDILFSYLGHKKLQRACIDATGLGMQLSEEAVEKFGQYKVEAITFKPGIKEEMAYHLRTTFENKIITVPSDSDIREDLHSVRKVTTTSDHIRFDVNADAQVSGHADRFWALALALHAAKTNAGPMWIKTGVKRDFYKTFEGY